MRKKSSRTAPSDRLIIEISDSNATNSDNEISTADLDSDNELNTTESNSDSEMSTTNPNSNDRETLMKATRQLTGIDSNSDGRTSLNKLY